MRVHLRRPAGPLWRDADFLRLWGGQTVSEVGSQITRLALPAAAIVALDASPAQVGLLIALQMLPAVVFGFAAGVWLDRVRRRRAMVACDAARLLALGSVPIAAVLDALTLEQLYAVAFISGVGTVIFNIAYQSYLPSLITRDHLGEGNAKMVASRSAAEVAGPGVGGVLVQAVGAAQAMALDAASFLASIVFLVRIRKPEPTPEPAARRRSFRSELAEGLSFIARTLPLRRIAICNVVLNLGLSISETLYFLFAYRELGLSPALVGLVVATEGASALVGALLAGRAQRRIGVGPALAASAALFGSGWLLLPAASLGLAIPVLFAAALLSGAGNAIYNVTQLTLRQTVTSDRLLGRVNATMRTLFSVPRPVGALVAGGFAAIAGYVPALLVGGGITVAASLFLMAPEMLALRRTEDWNAAPQR